MSGVAAGASGGFALVIGLARENNHAELRRHGADVVFADLAETNLEKINEAVRLKREAGAMTTKSSIAPTHRHPERSEGSTSGPASECNSGTTWILRSAQDDVAGVGPSGGGLVMKKKPLLNFWQLWNMSFGYVGIQFGFALQNANVSRIFETLGAKVDEIPILWIAGPVTGLLVQPVIGYLSDRTWNRLGPPQAVFPDRRGARLARPAGDAELADAVVRRRHALDPRCLDQRHHGAHARLRGRHAAR